MSGATGQKRERVIGLSGPSLDVIMPMHIWVSATGGVVRIGPTLRKILAGKRSPNDQLFDMVEIIKPRRVERLADFMALAGQKLILRFPELPDINFRGTLVQLPAGVGGLINLSFGLSVIDAVGRFGLTLKDFAPTDLTVEMLYLVEAKSAAMEESKSLNDRLQDARIAAESQAFTDTLTGLKNRRALDHVLDRLTEPPAEELFGLMHIDLDYFKQVNDTMGHAAGDHVLQHVAHVLASETREGDLVARVGGDEFVVVFRDCNDLDLLDRIARRMISELEKPTCFEGEPCRISASIGTTVSSYYPAPRPDQMLSDADLALYASKNKGRAQHTVFTPEGAQAVN